MHFCCIMVKMSDKYLITKKGVKILEEEIEKVKNDFLELLKTKRDAYYNQGDTWHDNSAFEEISREEVRLGKMIESLCEKLVNTEIIEENLIDKSVVNIGSIVSLSDGKKNKYKFQICGFRETDINSEPKKIEYLSSLVKGFIGKKVGHKEIVKIRNIPIELELINIE